MLFKNKRKKREYERDFGNLGLIKMEFDCIGTRLKSTLNMRKCMYVYNEFNRVIVILYELSYRC